MTNNGFLVNLDKSLEELRKKNYLSFQDHMNYLIEETYKNGGDISSFFRSWIINRDKES